MSSKTKWILGITVAAWMVTLTLAIAPGLSANPQQVATAEVKIDNFSFGPATLTVAPGTTVTWINHDDILAQIRSVTPQPLRYVINTHQHDDHAGGDALMLPVAEVIAHKNARANLVAHRTPYFEDTPGTSIGLPRITFSDETSVFLGGKEVRAHWFGRGHTSGDAIIYFPDLKVIHTGDLFLATGQARAGARTLRAPSPPARR